MVIIRTTFTDPDLQAGFSSAGYAVVPVLSAAGVAELVAAIDELHPADDFDPANNNAAHVSYHCSFLDADRAYKRRAHELISDTFGIFVNQYLSGYRILDGNFYVKPPGTGEFSIHQNWPCVTDLNDTTVTMWVPLVDVVGSNGALQVVEGSHKILPHVETPGADAYFERFRQTLIEEYLTPIPMTAGQGIIFDDSLIHWSARNEASEARIAVQITCIPIDATPAFFVKDGDDRFEIVSADTDFYLDQDVDQVHVRQPAWPSLGFVPNRNRVIDTDEFAWLMANRDEIRQAGHEGARPSYAAPIRRAAVSGPRSAGRTHRILAKIARKSARNQAPVAPPPSASGATRPRVVFLAHGAERSGPPIYLLHVLRWLVANTDIDARVVLLSGGPLESEFAELVPYRVLDRLHGGVLVSILARAAGPRVGPALRRATVRYRLRTFGDSSLVYVNTAGSVHALPFLPRRSGPVVSHIHELDVGMQLHLRPADKDLLLKVSERYIAASHAVADNLVRNHGVDPDRITVHYEMIDVGAADVAATVSASSLRAELNIPANALVVGSAGKSMWRKGPDLFIRLAQRLIARSERELHLVWVGSDEPGAPQNLRRDVERAGLAGRVHFVGEVSNPLDYFRLMDVFVLTAREDAYPLVCLEAASLAIPLVVFDRGGIPEFVGREDEPAGFVVPYPDLECMAQRIEQLLDDPPLRRRLGQQGRENVAVHDVGVAAPLLVADILDWFAT